MINKIVTYAAAAVATYGAVQITLSNHTIAKQADEIDKLVTDNETLRLNQETLTETLRLEVESRAEQEARWKETLAVHGRYLRSLRADAKRFAKLEDEFRTLEGQNETSSDFLATVGERLWPDPQTVPTGTSDTDVLSGSTEDSDTQ